MKRSARVEPSTDGLMDSNWSNETVLNSKLWQRLGMVVLAIARTAITAFSRVVKAVVMVTEAAYSP